MTWKERFWSLVNKNGPKVKKYVLKVWPELKGTHCWSWLGYKNYKGYGEFGHDYIKHILAHRTAYELFYKKSLKNYCLHKCDNPGCVNPFHLFDGTIKQNCFDMIIKGRRFALSVKGENHWKAKLCNKDVIYIRKHYSKKKRNGKILAARFGVSNGMIYNIVAKKLWTHI